MCQAYAIPSFDPFDKFRTRRSGQARRGKKLEVGGALRLRLEAKTSRQTTDDRGQKTESELRIADCRMRIAECRRHRAEGIGKDDRGQTTEGSSAQLSSSFASCGCAVIRSRRFAVICCSR